MMNLNIQINHHSDNYHLLKNPSLKLLFDHSSIVFPEIIKSINIVNKKISFK